MSEKYQSISEKIRKCLGLTYSPVSIKLLGRPNEIPDEINSPEKPVFYCTAFDRARKGETLVLKTEDHACLRGAAIFGVREAPGEVLHGDFYSNKSLVASPRAGRRLVTQAPKLARGEIYAILLAPLEKTAFDPDVVLISGNPRQALEIANAAIYNSGKEIRSRYSIPYDFCAYSTVLPYKTGDFNVAIPCATARLAAGYADEELIVGVPGEMIGLVAENIDKIGPVMKRLKKEATLSS